MTSNSSTYPRGGWIVINGSLTGQVIQDGTSGSAGGSGGSTAFTDDPVIAATTVVKAVHVDELRFAINSQRNRFSLAAFGWTDSSISPGITVVKAVHVQEMRTALSQAYAAAGMSAPSYAESIGAGSVIKGSHIMELRTLVVALEHH